MMFKIIKKNHSLFYTEYISVNHSTFTIKFLSVALNQPEVVSVKGGVTD